MTSPINGNAEINVEETFKKVLNLDGKMPSQILNIKEQDRYDLLIAIDHSCMKRIQQYGRFMEEANRLDSEYVKEIKGPCVLAGSSFGIVGGAGIGMVAGKVLNVVTSRFLPGISGIASFAKLTCYAVPIILGTKKGYEIGKHLAEELVESQHPNLSKLTTKMWENEVLFMGNTVIKIASELGIKQERLRHAQANQANLLQKEIQQLEFLLNHFGEILKNANSLNSVMMNKCLN